MKKITLLLNLLLTGFILFGQSISNCNLSGNDERWDSQWNQPGTTATIHAMLNGPDGNIWATGSYNGGWGGDPQINGLVTWDGKRWQQVGGDFQCTSCGLGTRYALAMDHQDNVYVGGFFQSVLNNDNSMVHAVGVVRWNHQDQIYERLGDVLSDNNFKGKVNALAVDTLGNILYIGGDFSKVVSLNGDTTAVNQIAALDLQTMSWSTVNGGVQNSTSSINGEVNALEMGPNQTLYVAGGFDEAGGVAMYSVAQWHPSNGWSSIGQGLPQINTSNNNLEFGTGHALHYEPISDRLYAGGVFGEFNSSNQPVDRSFAYFENDTWTLVSGIGKPFNTGSSRVQAITSDPQSGLIYVGGTFTTHVGNTSGILNLIGAWNPTMESWDTMNGGLQSSEVTDIVVQDDGIYVGGTFTNFDNGTHTNKFAKWDGNNWDNLGQGLSDINADIFDVLFHSDGFIATGNFSKIDSIDAAGLAQWRETTGWESVSFSVTANSNSNFNKLVYALHQEGDWIYFGGFCGGLGDGTTTTGIAAYNVVTNTYKYWGTGLDGSFTRVNDITVFKGDLYIAGRFEGINGLASKNIARLDLSTDTWLSIGEASNEVHVIENIKDSILIFGGSFTNISADATLERVAQYDGSNWSALGRGINNGVVRDITFAANTQSLFFSGSFTQLNQSDGSVLNSRLLAEYKNGAWATSFDTQTSPSLFRALEKVFYDNITGLVYITGQFSEVDGIAAMRIARFDPHTRTFGNLGSGINTLDETINFSATNANVNFIDRQGDFLVLAGTFYSTGLNQARGIARYDLEDYENDLAELDIALPDSLKNCDPVVLTSFANSISQEWSTGAMTSSITASQSGTYSVTVTSTNGCTNSDTTEVTIFEKPEIIFDGIFADSIFSCDTILLDPIGDFVEYQWNSGSNFESTYTATNSGWVTFLGQDTHGCFGSDSVFVIIPEYDLIVGLPDSLEACASTTLDTGTDDFNYLWSTGAMMPTIEVTESGTYMVTVTSLEGCTESETTLVTIHPNPTISFEGVSGDSLSACDLFILNPTGTFLEYNWNQGMSFDPTFEVTGSGWVSFEGQDSNNCIGSDSVYIEIESTPGVEFTSEIVGDTVFFSIIDPSSGVSYDWDFGDSQSATGSDVFHIYENSGDYTVLVQATNDCGTGEATATITVDFTDSQIEIFQPKYFEAFPNPTTGITEVIWEDTFSEGQLEIYTAQGKRLLIIESPAAIRHQLKIDITRFPTGIYLGKLKTEKGVYSFRLIKR